MREYEKVAAYVRASTDRQESQHQRDDITAWCSQQGLDPSSIEWYVDLGQSGSDPGREQFVELIEDMEEDQFVRVVVWEISRLARLGSIYQRFFESAADSETIVNITNGWTDTVKPDGTGKLIADISAAVAEEERRKLISRVNSGVQRARKEGKWLGEVPVGFTRNDDGYLRPLLTPDPDEDGYLDIKAALEEIEQGKSYRKAAKPMQTTRQTLSRIYQDEDRLAWYIEGDADDGRVVEALEEIW